MRNNLTRQNAAEAESPLQVDHVTIPMGYCECEGPTDRTSLSVASAPPLHHAHRPRRAHHFPSRVAAAECGPWRQPWERQARNTNEPRWGRKNQSVRWDVILSPLPGPEKRMSVLLVIPRLPPWATFYRPCLASVWVWSASANARVSMAAIPLEFRAGWPVQWGDCFSRNPKRRLHPEGKRDAGLAR